MCWIMVNQLRNAECGLKEKESLDSLRQFEIRNGMCGIDGPILKGPISKWNEAPACE